MELTILQFFARWVNLENKNENILIRHNNLCTLRCFYKIIQNSLMSVIEIHNKKSY